MSTDESRNCRIAETPGAAGRLPCLWVALLLSLALGCRTDRDTDANPATPAAAREDPFVVRPLSLGPSSSWKTKAICYGPYRDGQAPSVVAPTGEQVREDLRLLATNFEVLRVYGAESFVLRACEIIRQEGWDLKILVGAWIETETQGTPEKTYEIPYSLASNARQVSRAIELAQKYPDIVAAISVGNETQVSWSTNPVRQDRLIKYIRQVRAATKVPVTVADDFLFWCQPESQAVADELDFILTHIHALRQGQSLDQAIAFTDEKLALVRAQHPNRPVLLGEAGWATAKPEIGVQADAILGETGEAQQQQFLQALLSWAKDQDVAVFFFEAFDQNWKGASNEPLDLDKHWGLYRADRTPKQAVLQLQGEG